MSRRKGGNLMEVDLGWINGGRKDGGFEWGKMRRGGVHLFMKSGIEESGSLFQRWGKKKGMKE